MEEDWGYAGAGIAVNEDDGQRYMVLCCREGTGQAKKGRNLRPINTSHLTPDPVVVETLGNDPKPPKPEPEPEKEPEDKKPGPFIRPKRKKPSEKIAEFFRGMARSVSQLFKR